MPFCSKCGSHYFNSCGCKEYKIYHREYREDTPKIIRAKSESDALDRYANHDFYDDPCNPSDYEITLELNNKYYKVTAEAVVDFHVRELK